MANENTCDVCRKDPLKVDGCRVGVVFIEGDKFPRIPFFGDHGERCYDCNTLSGHYHHWAVTQRFAHPVAVSLSAVIALILNAP